WPDADLDPADQLALPESQVRDAQHERRDDRHDEGEVDRRVVQRRSPARAEPARRPVEQPLLHQGALSSVTLPNIGPRLAVDPCAAETLTQSSGSRSSTATSRRAWPSRCLTSTLSFAVTPRRAASRPFIQALGGRASRVFCSGAERRTSGSAK